MNNMVTITITISNGKISELTLGFLAAVPREPEDEGLTDLQFFKQWLGRQIFHIYKTGKIIIARGTTIPDIDEDIIENVE